jgi:O-antigen/teichoic acid export membrane protein
MLFGQKDFARGALYIIAENIITYGAVLVALIVGERAIMLVAAYFIANACATLFFTWRAQRHARNHDQDEGLFAFSAHLSAMNVLAAIADKFDSIIVFTLLGPAQLATYSFALAAPEQLKGVIKNLYGLALPKFATRTLSETYETIWPKLTLLSMGIACIVSAYILAAPYLFRYLFPIYTDSVIFSQWYAISVLFSGVSSVILAALAAHKKTVHLYISSNVPSVLLILLLIVLVPAFGIAGAIASQIGYRLMYAVITAWQFHRATRQEISSAQRR